MLLTMDRPALVKCTPWTPTVAQPLMTAATRRTVSLTRTVFHLFHAAAVVAALAVQPKHVVPAVLRTRRRQKTAPVMLALIAGQGISSRITRVLCQVSCVGLSSDGASFAVHMIQNV